jgi:hypothetical protein
VGKHLNLYLFREFIAKDIYEKDYIKGWHMKIKKSLFYIFLIFSVGCSYSSRKETSSSSIKINAVIKNIDLTSIDKIRNDTVSELRNIIFLYLSYPLKDKNASYYVPVSILKEKIKEKNISYSFEVDINGTINALKNKGILRDNRKKVCFVSDDYDFEKKDFLFTENYVVYFLSNNSFNKNLCNYIFDLQPLISTITTAAGNIYISSFSFVINNFPITITGVSNISKTDSVYKMLSDIETKLKSFLPESKDDNYVSFRFYNYLELEKLKKIYLYLSDKDFYTSLINDDFIEIKIRIKEKDIEEEVSKLIKLIPELSIDSIDSQKNIVILRFVKWDLNIF